MKRLSAILLTLALTLAFAGGGSLVSAQSVTVIVNGQTMNFTQPPIERAGRVFVPLRGVFEQLGASVVYANGQINATANRRTISLTIGSTQATVGGHPVIIDVAPFIVGATTYVPLRFISQALGASVNWDDSTSTVTINSGGSPPQPAPPPPPPVRFVSVSPTGTIYTPRPRLSFQFNRPVRLADIRVWFDGQRIASGLQLNGEIFAITLPWRISVGAHRVRVAGVTPSGASFDLSWSFIRG